MAAKSPFILAIILSNAPAFARGDTGYLTVQSIAVSHGHVQILQDERLTSTLARRLWRTEVDVMSLGEDNPAAQPFKKKPPLPAKLRQIDGAGVVVLDVVLEDEAPVARIEARKLGAPLHPVYLVTTDDDAGFGSYSGRATALYSMQDGRFTPVKAASADGRFERIILAETLKSGWKIVDPSRIHTVIQQILCRPDFGNEKPGKGEPFLLTYITYWSDGKAWRMAKRVTSGFWENEGQWPAASKFPRAGANHHRGMGGRGKAHVDGVDIGIVNQGRETSAAACAPHSPANRAARAGSRLKTPTTSTPSMRP
jgi:hypothetical protein